jgi:hypothetical protein
MNLLSVEEDDGENLILMVFDAEKAEMFEVMEGPREIPSIEASEEVVEVTLFVFLF